MILWAEGLTNHEKLGQVRIPSFATYCLLAQLVEQQTENLRVTGSTPVEAACMVREVSNHPYLLRLNSECEYGVTQFNHVSN